MATTEKSLTRIKDLQDGERVMARCGCRGVRDIFWGPWNSVVLSVSPYAVLSLKGENWPEYGRHNFQGDVKMFVRDGHYLEIEGVEV